MKKFLGLIIAGALAAMSQSANAAVIFLAADANVAGLHGWGDYQEMTARKQPYTAGPVQATTGLTFKSTNADAVVGYTGKYNFGANPMWNAGKDGPAMAGLNAATGSISFDFAAPVSGFLAELNWATGFSNGAPIFISIFNSDNQLLETFQLSDGLTDTLQSGFYGFNRESSDIARVVLSNGYIGARNFYTRGYGEYATDYSYNYGGGGGGGGGSYVPPEQPPLGEHLAGAVPEPGTWLLMIVGFGATGAMLRRARRLTPVAIRI